MRTTLRVLSIVCILLAATAAVLAWTLRIQSSVIDGRGYLYLCLSGLGMPLGFGTFIVGLIATAQSRQFRWLIGFIATAVIAIATLLAAGVISATIGQSTRNNAACQMGVCHPTLFQRLLSAWVYLALPFLVGLVVLLYSFRAREPRVPVSPTMTTMR